MHFSPPPFRNFSPRIPMFLLAFSLFLLSSCSCCLYFNHFYNAKKAYEKAKDLQEARLDSLPTDTLAFTPEEKVQWDRTIEKCSKILEKYPTETKYKPTALFMMAESYRNLTDYPKALRKYDEFERYFSEDSVLLQEVQYKRALVLFKSGQLGMARYALDPVLSPSHRWQAEGLKLLSQIDIKGENWAKAAESLEKLLEQKDLSPFLKNKARFELAQLYFEQKKYNLSIKHDSLLEEDQLPRKMYFESQMRIALALHFLGSNLKSIDFLAAMLKEKKWKSYVNILELRLGQLELKGTHHPSGRERLLDLAHKIARSDTAAESWHSLASFSQDSLKKYEQALHEWDSCANAYPSGKWSREALEKRKSLFEFMSLQNKKNTPGKSLNSDEEFNMAELFLFKLSQTDSALIQLEKISSSPQSDSMTKIKSLYAQAFVWDEYKKDSSKSNQIYRILAQDFPNSTFGIASQKILGISQVSSNQENQIQYYFAKAESAWVQSDVQSFTQKQSDSCYKLAITYLDSALNVPGSPHIKAIALLLKGTVLEKQNKLEQAKDVYKTLEKDYPKTPQGEFAIEKIYARTRLSEAELKAEHRRLEEMIQLSKNEENRRLEQNKQEEEKARKQKEANEEILQDFEELYQLQR